MNPADPLAALAPLRAPEAIGAWPPAPGWWLLAITVLAGIAAGAIWLLRRYQRNRYRRQGLEVLKRIEERYQQNRDPIACSAAINSLLKRVALQAYPQRNIAALSGQDWVDFLQDSGAGVFEPVFADLHYRPRADHMPIETLLTQAREWINQHEVTA